MLLHMQQKPNAAATGATLLVPQAASDLHCSPQQQHKQASIT
jgi:hypothetical protein